MAANSLFRRALKDILHPLLPERAYRYFQGAAMAWDMRTGNWTETELDLVPHLVRRGDTVCDVGANYGVWSRRLGQAVGPQGRVLAFEPIPFTAATFRVVAKLLQFRHVSLIEKGLSNENAEVTFDLPVQSSGAVAAGQAHLGGRKDAQGATRSVVCQVVRLDDFLVPSQEVAFIKCDVEGAELMVFEGAVQTIERHCPTVLCEINTSFLAGFGIPLARLTGFFFDRGYSLYWYDHDVKRLVPAVLEGPIDDNYLFVHDRRRARLANLFAA